MTIYLFLNIYLHTYIYEQVHEWVGNLTTYLLEKGKNNRPLNGTCGDHVAINKSLTPLVSLIRIIEVTLHNVKSADN